MPKGSSRSKHHLNLSAFAEPLSAEAKYWIGFLLADGCISNGIIGLKLMFNDAGHIRKFAKFVGVLEESVLIGDCTNTTFGCQCSAQLMFTGKELIPQLAKYGVVPKKTWTALVPEALARNPDFWRGLIDGDGSVGKSHGYNQIQFCGNFDLVEGFSDICKIITGLKPRVSPSRSIFHTGLIGSKATKLLKWLYYPGAVALERKAKAWQG